MSVELAACMYFKFFNVTFCTLFFALLHFMNKEVSKSTICVLLAPTLAKFSQAHKGNL